MAGEPNSIFLTFRYRLLPTRSQHRRLRTALEHSRQLYNAALAERIDCYRKTKKGRSYADQSRALTELRQDVGSPYAVSMERAPLKALDLAYRAFFARGGFPRFKGKDWFKSIGWLDADGWRVRDGRFVAKGIGAIRVHMHRSLPSTPKTARIKREGRHWYLTLACEVGCASASDNPSVGIDVGLSHLAALSTGELVANERPYRRAMRELRLRQRALARCKRGSKRRRKVRGQLASAHRRIRQSRATYLHQVSADLTERFGLIAVEKLNVKGLGRGILAKEVHDASWGRLRELLQYKATLKGGTIVEVDPRYTSQTCPECGQVKPKTLADRVHRCDCGCEMDRDVAAAKIVLQRAVHGPHRHKVSGCAVPADRKAVA